MSQARKQVVHVQELIEEVIVTFRRLRVAAAEIHGAGSPMPGQRGVLMDLARADQTVAEMARSRGVSRQHVQALVDNFCRRGLVELADNPAHRRSKLVSLTTKGKELIKAMARRELAALGSLEIAVPAIELQKAAAALRVLGQALRDYSGAHRRSVARRKKPN